VYIDLVKAYSDVGVSMLETHHTYRSEGTAMALFESDFLCLASLTGIVQDHEEIYSWSYIRNKKKKPL